MSGAVPRGPRPPAPRPPVSPLAPAQPAARVDPARVDPARMSAADRAAGLLPALVRLAAERPAPDQLVPAALECVRQALGAESCAVWGDGAGPQAAGVRWRTAPDAPAADGGGAHPLVAGGARVGTLRVHGGEPADLGPVCDFLAAIVYHADEAARAQRVAAAHAASADAERRFVGDVIDALPLGVYVTDRDHRVRLWNRKRELGTLGVAREAAVGRPIFEVLPRQDAALMRAEFEAVLASGQPQQFEIESHSTGEARTYRLSKLPMAPDDAGRPTHVLTLGEDVTEWKAALGRSAQAEKLAAVGQLAAGVMHEINNPLGTIAACAETMTLALAELPAGATAPAGFGEYLRIVDHEVHRCRRIAESLLELSRAKTVRRARLALDDVVERTLSLLKHHTRFKRCPVRLDLGGDLAVVADPDQLTQVLMILLLNAADAVAAAPPRGEDEPARGVTVRTAPGREGLAVLEVADDGVGIAPEARGRVFEPFYTTKAPGEGTGLGLSIAYGIVRDLGGDVAVDSEPGAGARFRVTLPAAPEGDAP